MIENVSCDGNLVTVDSRVLESEFVVVIWEIGLPEKERDLEESENCQRSWLRYGGGYVRFQHSYHASVGFFFLDPIRTLLLCMFKILYIHYTYKLNSF